MKDLALVCLLWGVSQSPGGVDPQGLVGAWRGEGRYVEVEPDRELGPVIFTLYVDASFHGEGTVGEARIREWKLEKSGRVLRIEARLEGRIRMDAPPDKDDLVLLVEEVGVNTFTAEFKLRGDAAFDPRPAEGRVTFMRVRPLRDPERPGGPATEPNRP
ncbi:MAG: hypothetical protein HYZ13_09470 [Acidobacteria bacterium]|nr:hypothetical protein [Acidobacteriota bacterium]